MRMRDIRIVVKQYTAMQAVVIMSRFPCVQLYEYMLPIVAKEYFARGLSALRDAYKCILKWYVVNLQLPYGIVF